MQQKISLILALIIPSFAFYLSNIPNGKIPSFALLCGLMLGIVMQRSRFCFYCHLRDWFEYKDPRGALALLLAIAVGLIGYTIVVGSWQPNPLLGNIPPDIHVGAVSEVLFAAGFVFGLGMVITESCISAHWYHLSEGSFISFFALIGTGFGFFIGFNTWNSLYSLRISDAPIIWLPSYLGYSGALILQLGVILLLALFLWRGFAKEEEEGTSTLVPSFSQAWKSLWIKQWSYWVGGLIIGLIGIAAIIRMKPLGVTATVASWIRKISNEFGLIPSRLNGLDAFAGCSSLPQHFWLNQDALLLFGIVVGSFIASLAGGHFEFQKPTFKGAALGLIGGTMLGWGAMTAIGCTIGTLLSGTQAGALSGWVFAISMLLAIWSGIKIKGRFLAKQPY
ncbi:MAG: YeeE/YedE family protein [Campylobacteraceae bacterium]|nr:YeeE/YedE family protein [Campylobacteraceae bacterium]